MLLKDARFAARFLPSALDWSYTVPTRRAAYLDAAMAFVFRNTLAGGNGQVTAGVYVSDIGLGNTQPVVEAHLITDVIGDGETVVIGAYGTIPSGYLIRALYSNLSPGGTVWVGETAKITEFDAL